MPPTWWIRHSQSGSTSTASSARTWSNAHRPPADRPTSTVVAPCAAASGRLGGGKTTAGSRRGTDRPAARNASRGRRLRRSCSSKRPTSGRVGAPQRGQLAGARDPPGAIVAAPAAPTRGRPRRARGAQGATVQLGDDLAAGGLVQPVDLLRDHGRAERAIARWRGGPIIARDAGHPAPDPPQLRRQVGQQPGVHRLLGLRLRRPQPRGRGTCPGPFGLIPSR